MARGERNKEEIGWLKVVFAAAVALDASLIAWLAQNYHREELLLITMAAVLVGFFTFLVVYVNRLAFRRLDELEEL